MKKFRVNGRVFANKYLGEYEAETAKEAIRKALDSDANHFSICHQCANEIEVHENFCDKAEADEVEEEQEP